MSDPKIAGEKPVIMELEPGKYFWCRCGLSEGQPYCDGAHAETEFTPVEFTIEEKKSYALCLCKRTANEPFCDGAHKKLKNDD